MTDFQVQMARRRLALGISNVGFWVLISAVGLRWGASLNEPTWGGMGIGISLLALLGVQSVFDFIGGAVLMPNPKYARKRFFSVWCRGMGGYAIVLCAVAALNFWSFCVSGGFYAGVAVASLVLFLGRFFMFGLVSGAPAQDFAFAPRLASGVDAKDPSFTGGICGFGRSARPLMPAAWITRLSAVQIQVVLERRRFMIDKYLEAKSLIFLIFWNWVGCWTGEQAFDFSRRSPEHALVLQFCWMMLWGFFGLLVLPSLSRSSVFAADRAVSGDNASISEWIRLYPSITGEDGHAKSIWQRIFYPIPSAAERLHALGRTSKVPVLGGVARMNLFLSLATLSILGRCVHCNVGRPELWIYPPVD